MPIPSLLLQCMVGFIMSWSEIMNRKGPCSSNDYWTTHNLTQIDIIFFKSCYIKQRRVMYFFLLWLGESMH